MSEGFIYVWGLPARTWTALGAKAESNAATVAPRTP